MLTLPHLGDDTFADYESDEGDFDPAAILQSVAKEAAKKRKAVTKQPKSKIPKLGQSFPSITSNPSGFADLNDDEEEDQTTALLRRVQQLETIATQAAVSMDYKKKYEDLLHSSNTGTVSTIVPSEPPPNASLVKGFWQEDGKEPHLIKDNGMSSGSTGTVVMAGGLTVYNASGSPPW